MSTFATTRGELQRVAVHVLARRRHAMTGRFGLRATPGGFGTPAFGPDDAVEVVRIDGTTLVHEIGAETRHVQLTGASLAEVAGQVGVDLAADFSVGRDTPPLGDLDAPLAIEPAHAEVIGEWYRIGWQALDRIAGVATVQLWPEHFDAGTWVATGPGTDDRVDLGASPGDAHHDEPYLYVSPWSKDRPSDAEFWNAPFGALLGRSDVDSVDTAVAFLSRGIELVSP